MRKRHFSPTSRLVRAGALIAFASAAPQIASAEIHDYMVLRLVYLTDKEGETKGGFYPNGMNGALKTT